VPGSAFVPRKFRQMGAQCRIGFVLCVQRKNGARFVEVAQNSGNFCQNPASPRLVTKGCPWVGGVGRRESGRGCCQNGPRSLALRARFSDADHHSATIDCRPSIADRRLPTADCRSPGSSSCPGGSP
jgi:hypothetical protein